MAKLTDAPATGSGTAQANPLPRVDIVQNNGRTKAVYLDQFLVRGVRAVSFEEHVGGPTLVKLEVVVSDVVVRDAGTAPPPTPGLGELSARSPEGAYLIGSDDESTGHDMSLACVSGACPGPHTRASLMGPRP